MTDDSDPRAQPVSSRGTSPVARLRLHLITRYRWLPFVLPLTIYLLLGTLEPSPKPARQAQTNSPTTQPRAAKQQAPASTTDHDNTTTASSTAVTYPVAYTVKFLATLAVVLFFAPFYYSTSTWRVHSLAILVGIVGTIVWIALAKLGLASKLLTAVGLADWLGLGARPAFDPLSAFASRWQLIGFLLVRFAGLVVLVPLIEEFFLRGFLMRFVMQPDWWNVPLGKLTPLAFATATVYGVLTHPAEPLAAAVWFTGITIYYGRTRNLGDCVVAHATTNLLLGIYIVVWHAWSLW